MAKAKARVERTIEVADVVRACSGGGKFTMRQIFSTLQIPSGYRTNQLGKWHGPTDHELTQQAVLALNYAVSSGKLKWNQNKRGAGTPILYWSHLG